MELRGGIQSSSGVAGTSVTSKSVVILGVVNDLCAVAAVNGPHELVERVAAAVGDNDVAMAGGREEIVRLVDKVGLLNGPPRRRDDVIVVAEDEAILQDAADLCVWAE